MTEIATFSPDVARALDARPTALQPVRLFAAWLLILVGLIATLGAWEEVLDIALQDEEASHIWLVLPLAAALVYVRRGSLANARVVGTWFGPILAALGWGVSHYGFNHATQSLYHFGALMVVGGCAVSVLGVDVFRRAMPAVLLLAFLIPMPITVRQQIAIPLERVTARAVQWLLSWFPLTITRMGNHLTLNGHSVEVAEECNGMRMVFPLFLITYVFVFVLPLKAWVQWLLLLASPAVAVMANVLRLIPTVFIFGYASPSKAKMFHDVSGWLMLPITFLILMGLLEILKWMKVPVMRPKAMPTRRTSLVLAGS